MDKNFRFNGIKKEYIKVLKGRVLPILAPRAPQLITISNRPGAIQQGYTTDVRKIEVPIWINKPDGLSFGELREDLAEWLATEKPVPLQFEDEPGRVYYAMLEEIGNLELVNHQKATTTIRFVCPDPYKYSDVEKVFSFNPTDDTALYVENKGDAETYPNISMDFTENLTSFSVIANDEFLMFGNDDIDNSPVDPRPLVLHEDFSTLNGWTAASSVDDGIISGAFSSNGSAIRPETWGTGSGWHGPSLVKGLPKQLQDFHVRCRFGNRASKVGQLGRVEVYLLDANGNKIGKIALRNGNPNAVTPLAQARIKNNYVVNTYGSFPGVWRNWGDGYMDVT
ncbi:MAG: distal tail protein Dit, partial [Bacillus sp. (in: firmicutes)]